VAVTPKRPEPIVIVQPVIVRHVHDNDNDNDNDNDYKKSEGDIGRKQEVSEEREQVPVVAAPTFAELPKTIPELESKQFPKQFGNNSESELFVPDKPTPQAAIAPYKKIGKVGRKRRYEEPGMNGEIPVKKVVLYRHIRGRHWPGMSDDMREWYEHYYFTKPTRTERAKDAKDYERHVKSYERGRQWIAAYATASNTAPLQGTGTLGDSRKVLPYRKRATGSS
jgi:hypothetical protein